MDDDETSRITIAVAVALRSCRVAPTVELSLAALRREAVDPVLVDVSAGQSLAQARNEALATTAADILAFVDDDVAVGPGWHDALREAWAHAPRDCACIGGPIAARFIGERPDWLSDALLGVLGVTSAGGTFHGGNVSFRTTALRGIGGFWPMRGREELRDWFSEEHYAQEQLFAAGWNAARNAALAADRIIIGATLSPLDVLERRARYGARAALVGHRPRVTAARTMARSTVGTALAAIRGDTVHATERAARAAENAGALAAPLLARRDLEPTVTETPFLYSVPRPRPRRAWLVRRSVAPLILVYHRVDQDAGVAPAHFREQMEVLASRRTPTPLEAIVAGEAPPDAAAITFDDGYQQTVRNVWPALEDAGVPATIFVSTGHVRTGRSFWWDVVERLLLRAGPAPVRLTIDGETREWARGDRARRHVIAWLQPKSPEAIAEVTDALARELDCRDDPSPNERPLTIEDVRMLGRSRSIAVGSHTRAHTNLRRVDATRRASELMGSRDDLAQWLGSDPPTGLAYPYGVPGADLDDETERAARDAGYTFAVVTADGVVTPASNRYALPRVAAPDAGADQFDRLLSIYGARA